MHRHKCGTRTARIERHLRLESLEQRTLLTVDVVPGVYTDMGDDQLQIIGTEGVDEVHISYSASGDHVIITENGRAYVMDITFDHIYFEGRGGDDTFTNDTDIPTIATGGAGHDELYGGSFANILAGDDGNDVIHGRGVWNLMFGDACDVDTSAANFPDTYRWGIRPGNDTLMGGFDINMVLAGAGNDTIIGGEGFNWLMGEEGDDVISGGEGDDMLVGGAGDDLLRGGGGGDWLVGEAGDDILVGEDGDDLLYGGLGRDLLISGRGKDELYGTPKTELSILPGCRVADHGDILIGGTTDYDKNDRALRAIVDRWNDLDSKDRRIASIQRGVGPFGIYALNDTTVHDDGVADIFTRLGSADWVVEGRVLGMIPPASMSGSLAPNAPANRPCW